MGEVIVRFRMHGPKGSHELEGIADTGATFTKIPKEVAELIGIERRYEVEVELADGKVVKRDAGLAEIEINNIRRPVLVTFSDADEKTTDRRNDTRDSRAKSKPNNEKARTSPRDRISWLSSPTQRFSYHSHLKRG